MNLQEYFDKLNSNPSKEDLRILQGIKMENGPAYHYLYSNFKNEHRPKDGFILNWWHIYGALNLMNMTTSMTDGSIYVTIQNGEAVDKCRIDLVDENCFCKIYMSNGDIFGYSINRYIDIINVFEARYNI